jgi:hypothetical protein
LQLTVHSQFNSSQPAGSDHGIPQPPHQIAQPFELLQLSGVGLTQIPRPSIGHGLPFVDPSLPWLGVTDRGLSALSAGPDIVPALTME